MGKSTLIWLLAALLGLPGAARQPAPGLVICHAGSLSAAFKAVGDLYTRQTGVPVIERAGGSVDLARQLASGKLSCDLFASADFEVIDRMLKPAGLAGGSLRFAAGAMVLAYSTDSRGAATIAAPGGPWAPPDSVPMAAPDWWAQLTQPGVRIGGSHPFLDPGGYRADLIFQLAQAQYRVANLYNDLLGHYSIGGPAGGLGKSFDYQFTYEHSALATVRADPGGTYRYVRLPDEVSLGAPGLDPLYGRVGITLPGLQTPGAPATVHLPAGRVTWGITLMKAAPNREHALAFLELLLGSQGTAILRTLGPAPISPARTSREDLASLPASLKALVQAP